MVKNEKIVTWHNNTAVRTDASFKGNEQIDILFDVILDRHLRNTHNADG